MNNANIPARQVHWLQVKTGLAEARATNGLGWAVHYLPGRVQVEETRSTVDAARWDLKALPDATDYGVMEVLSEPVESPAVAMRRIADQYASDCRKFCMGVLA